MIREQSHVLSRQACTSHQKVVLRAVVKMPIAERQAEPGGDFARKRMKRSTEMTLEKVYDRYRWPSDEIIAGICTLHREMSPGKHHVHSMCST